MSRLNRNEIFEALSEEGEHMAPKGNQRVFLSQEAVAMARAYGLPAQFVELVLNLEKRIAALEGNKVDGTVGQRLENAMAQPVTERR